MLASNERITKRQLQILIVLSGVGTGVIVLPHRIAEYLPHSLQDGWAVALVLTVIGMGIAGLISAAVFAMQSIYISADKKEVPPSESSAYANTQILQRRISFLSALSQLFTKPVAYFCAILLWIKLVLSAGLEMRAFMQVSQAVLLPETPMFVVGGVMLCLCAYMAVKGIESGARVAEVLIGITVLPFLFLFILGAGNMDFSNLQPVLVTPPADIAYTAFRMGFVFTGLECLLLVGAFVSFKHGSKTVRGIGMASVAAVGLVGILITMIVAVTIGHFGMGIATEPWPVMRMMDMIVIPGGFIERQEALMFSFWIITTFLLCGILLFSGGYLAKEIIMKRHSTGVRITLLAAFAICIMPWEDIGGIYQRLDFLYMSLGLFFMVILPIFILIAAKFNHWAHERMTLDRTPIAEASETTALSAKFGRLAGGKKIFSARLVKKLSTMLLLGCMTVSLSACWDKVEIENRAFLLAIGIDAISDEAAEAENDHSDRYKVTLSMPMFTSTDSEKISGEENPSHIKTATGRTVTEALNKLEAKSDKQLYYGQTKLIVLGNDLLENATLLQNALATLTNNRQIDRHINMLATDGEAFEILKMKPPGENLPGLYVADIYRHKNKLGGTSFSLDLERLRTALTTEHYCGAIMPTIIKDASDEDALKLGGAVILQSLHAADELYGANESGLHKTTPIPHAAKLGFFTSAELRGYLWCIHNGGNNAVIITEGIHHTISLKVESHHASVTFEPTTQDQIRTILDIKITGHIEDHSSMQSLYASQALQQNLKAVIASQIEQEILETAEKLQSYNIDAYNWRETLRKKNYPLYQQHAQCWNEIFPKMEIAPQITVELFPFQ